MCSSSSLRHDCNQRYIRVPTRRSGDKEKEEQEEQEDAVDHEEQQVSDEQRLKREVAREQAREAFRRVTMAPKPRYCCCCCCCSPYCYSYKQKGQEEELAASICI